MYKKLPKETFLKKRLEAKQKLEKIGHKILPWQVVYYTYADRSTLKFIY